jgi:hypothetical protein
VEDASNLPITACRNPNRGIDNDHTCTRPMARNFSRSFLRISVGSNW